MPFFGVPIRNGLPIGLGSVAGFGVQQFDPSELFVGGTVAGAWYDPSDLSTMFTTSAGTTPVAMPGLGSAVSVGLMLDKSQNGVGTNGAKRVNLLTFSEQFDNAAWTKDGATAANTTATTDPLGGTTADILTATSAGAAYAYQGITAPTATVAFSCYVKAATASVFWMYYDSGGTNGTAFFGTDLTTQAVSGGSQTPSSLTITSVGNGWFRISAQWSSVSGSRNFGVGICDAKGSLAVTIGRTGYVWGADVRLASEANTLPLYQPITSSWYATLPGNHAIAFNNTTARPELRARVNLLTKTEQFDDAAWAKASGVTVSANTDIAPDGTLTADTVTSGANQISQSVSCTTNTIYTDSLYFKKTSGAAYQPGLYLLFSGGTFIIYAVRLNTDTGVATAVSAGGFTAPAGFSVADVGAYWRLSITGNSNNNTTADLRLYANLTAGGGSGAGSQVIWGADLRPANIGANVPAYQRIADANTYDTSGFPLYLRFDGVDDSMYTPANLNLSGTDKVAVFAGVRKLSAALGFLAELSANTSANNGSFYVVANNGTNDYGISLRGTAQATYQPATYTAPISNVLAVSYDIAGAAISDEIVPRVNGVVEQDNPTGANAGTGNFGTHPLFIGARNNASSWFNGHLHSLIIAGSAVSAGNISATEQWVAQKTGIAIP